MPGVADFAERHPLLFHVTDRSSLPSIRRNGLLPSTALCELFGVTPERCAILLEDNRDRYELLEHPQHGRAVLRRQLMREAVMATRLAPGLSPAAWRRFINGMVFFVVDARRAARLRDYDDGRDQVVLVWCTRTIMDAGLELRTCRYNNGMVDRTPAHRRRLRCPDDYVPASRYCGGPIAEVAATAAVPPGIPFVIHNET
jgi:hypothetical protein